MFKTLVFRALVLCLARLGLGWASSPADDLQTDRAALCSFYNSLTSRSFLKNWICSERSRFMSPCPDVGDWTGVTCGQVGNTQRVVGLALANVGLAGTLPTTLGNLKALTMLNLGTNNLVGSLPTQLGLLTNLQGLFLSNNQFTGVVPNSFCSFKTSINMLLYCTRLSCMNNCLSTLTYTNLKKDTRTGYSVADYPCPTSISFSTLPQNSVLGPCIVSSSSSVPSSAPNQITTTLPPSTTPTVIPTQAPTTVIY